MVRHLCCGCLLLLGVAPARAADPWHLNGWQARAVVEITRAAAEPDVDAAAVKILGLGRGKPDGADYRVLDGAGQPVPFQLTYHDAAHYSLISFRAAAPRGRYFVYFGNPQAAKPPEMVLADPAPGSGPPKGAWVPRFGLVYETRQRIEGKNPETVADMARLLAACPFPHGARYQCAVSDGYNPFGPSDYYVSAYRGWIRIPKAGKYQFCTASNEASFSFLDGKELVHWPGRHTVERGLHGEKNAAVELTAGLHYLEYYHEEVTLEQMAFLGWRPSGDAGPFGPIPEAVYTTPHQAAVTHYEEPKGPLPAFEPVITDSVWPVDRAEGQYTRCRFQADVPAGTACTWDFGDGQTATGPAAEHVYLALGTYTVTLTTPAGVARWPLLVYEIEHVTEQFKEGKPADYAKLAKGYDRGKLNPEGLRELAFLLAEAEDPAAALEAGKAFVDRFGAQRPKEVPRVRRLLAECALKLGQGGVAEAISQYRQALTPDVPTAERLDVLARLVRLVGIDRGLPDEAAPILAEVESAARGATFDEATKAAYRRAVVAGGDVLLWHGKLDGARDLYKRAETLGAFIPSQVRAARVGAYPDTLKEYVAGGNYAAALDVVSQWEESFPTEKLQGQTFFWRGKLLLLRGQAKDAARHLARAVGLAPGAVFESEARWLLAQALEQIGKPDEAKKELARLVAAGFTDEFAKMARAKLGMK